MATTAKTGEETRKRPTLRTIAELSGLAMTTVSRALGDAPDISAETKEKVRRIAAEVGYVPNRAGVRLRTGRTNVIALVLPTEQDAMNMTPRLIAAIASGLGGTSYHLVVIPELPHQDPMDPIRYIVETGSADAVIINRIEPEDRRIAYLRQKRFPFVTHGRSVWAAEHAYFDYDNRAFGTAAVERLHARGRREILLVGPPRAQSYGRDMLEGAREAAGRLGVALHAPDALTADDSREAVAAGVSEALQLRPLLDGLIVSSPNATMAAVAALEAAGRTLGQDVDVFAKETFPFLEMFRPALLTLQEDIPKAGSFLARAALHEISSGGATHMQHVDRPDGDE